MESQTDIVPSFDSKETESSSESSQLPRNDSMDSSSTRFYFGLTGNVGIVLRRNYDIEELSRVLAYVLSLSLSCLLRWWW